MSDTPNVIVGAHLNEFLALGCRFGYFALDQLIHAREETIKTLEAKRFGADSTGESQALLQRLARSFNLKRRHARDWIRSPFPLDTRWTRRSRLTAQQTETSSNHRCSDEGTRDIRT